METPKKRGRPKKQNPIKPKKPNGKKSKKGTDDKKVGPGAPPFFESAEQMEEKIQAYFEKVKGLRNKKIQDPNHPDFWIDPPEPESITGLCLFLGFESRQSFYDYEKRPEFSYTVKRARLRVENSYEKRLGDGKPTGAIFALKNLGWADEKKVDLTSKGNHISLAQYSDDDLRKMIDGE